MQNIIVHRDGKRVVTVARSSSGELMLQPGCDLTASQMIEVLASTVLELGAVINRATSAGVDAVLNVEIGSRSEAAQPGN